MQIQEQLRRMHSQWTGLNGKGMPIHHGNSPEGESDSTITPRSDARCDTLASHVDYLRGRYRECQLSEEASELLLASWREKSSKSYDSLFRKWLSWYNERNSDPVSGPIGEVVNFLADLFKKGYQYRSLNVYRSATSPYN